jgi:PAS domain S-box-containing protein
LQSAFEQKKVHILVRWLLIILAFHFVAFSRVDLSEFNLAINTSYLLILSNLALMGFPRKYFSPGPFVQSLIGVDLAFIALFLYFIREPGSHYHWLFIILLGVLIWRLKIREALIAFLGGLVVLSLTSVVISGRWLFFRDTANFLRTSILFAVALLYLFVVELLRKNAFLFHIVERAKHEWERTADAMDEFILLTDVEGQIHRVNRALAQHLGSTPRELVGKPWHVVLDNSEQARLDSPLVQAFSYKKPIETRHTHSALGREALAIAIPLFEGDAVVGAVYVLRL